MQRKAYPQSINTRLHQKQSRLCKISVTFLVSTKACIILKWRPLGAYAVRNALLKRERRSAAIAASLLLLLKPPKLNAVAVADAESSSLFRPSDPSFCIISGFRCGTAERIKYLENSVFSCRNARCLHLQQTGGTVVLYPTGYSHLLWTIELYSQFELMILH